MLATKWVMENFEMPDRNIYKLSKFNYPRAHCTPKTRTTSNVGITQTAVTPINLTTDGTTKLQKEIARARKQLRQIHRERVSSIFRESSHNEKIKLSSLQPHSRSKNQTPDFSTLYDRFQTPLRKTAPTKRKPVELPQRKLFVKTCIKGSRPKLVINRDYQDRPLTERRSTVLITSRSEQVMQNIPKLVITKKHDEFKEMMDIFSDRRVKAIVSDVSLRKSIVDYDKLRLELRRTLVYVSRLNLDLQEVLEGKVFSQKPFGRPFAYELIHAAKIGRLDEIQELVAQSKYIVYDFDYIYMTALHWACKRGHFDVAKFLIDKGADIEFQDIIGRPALYFSIIGGNNDIVKLLLDKKANPWSTDAVNYTHVCQQYNPTAQELLGKARKQFIMLKMTPPYLRNQIWKNLRK